MNPFPDLQPSTHEAGKNSASPLYLHPVRLISSAVFAKIAVEFRLAGEAIAE
jgi:hypothetical protein